MLIASVRGFLLAALLMFIVIGVFWQNTARSEKPEFRFVTAEAAVFPSEPPRIRSPNEEFPNDSGTIEFTLPPKSSASDKSSAYEEYWLVIGCLNGELRGNQFSLTSSPFSDSAGQISPLPIEMSVRRGPILSHSPQNLQRNQSDKDSRVELKLASGKQKAFSLFMGQGRMGDAESYRIVSTTKVAESDHLQIWCDVEDQQQLSRKTLQRQVNRLVSTFESIVVRHLIPWLGKVEDLDQTEKFSIVLTTQLDHLQEGTPRLKGLTWGGDFRLDLKVPYGNQSDMIYLNPSNTDLDSASAILLHEYVHAISFSHRCRRPSEEKSSAIVYEQDWLNEAISHVVETRLSGCYSNIDYRLDEYEATPESYPLIVPNYYQKQMWRNHGCRGAVYSFLDWCVEQEGEQLIPQLLHSSKTGLANLEEATGKSFESLFRRWSMVKIETQKNSRRQVLSAGDFLKWEQAGTSVKYLRLSAGSNRLARYQLQHHPDVRVQLTLVPVTRAKLSFAGHVGKSLE